LNKPFPNSPALFSLPHLGSLSVSGADARTFLHGQFTNDLLHLAPGMAQLSAWCTAQGRVIANFLLYACPLADGAEAIRLILSENLLSGLPQGLGRYAFRAKVRFTEEEVSHLGLSGAGTEADAALLAEALAAAGLPEMPSTALAVTQGEGCSLLRLPDNDRLILSIPSSRLDEMREKLAGSLPLLATELWHYLDVHHVLPWVSAATTEAFVPQMMNLEQLGGVNFKKGCYPGQEIVARTHYLGQVKRRLYRVESRDILAAGDEWPKGAEPIGKILQAAPLPNQDAYIALAVLSCKEAEATEAVALCSDSAS